MGWKKALDAGKAAVDPFARSSQRSRIYFGAGVLLLALGALFLCRRPTSQTSFPAVMAAAAPAVEKKLATVEPLAVAGEKAAPAEATPVPMAAEASGSSASLLEQARREDEKAGDDLAALEHARELYQQALATGRLESQAEAQCVARLTELTYKLILNPRAACSKPKAVFHTVVQGDVVEKLAKKYRVGQTQIKRLNKLSDKLIIRYGQVLKMLPGDVVYKVDRTRLTGTLYIDGVFIRRYPVGIGPGNTTPPGTYSIENKVINPDWWYDGKKIPFGDSANILGTRWMGISATDTTRSDAGLGIHGTAQPQSVPGRESKGCVRMLNADVEELFDLMPQGGKLQIL